MEHVKQKMEFIASHIKKREKVLDIGCGIGAPLFSYLKKCDYVGLDIIEEDKVLSYNLNDGILDFKDKLFNVVVMSFILEHIERPVDILKEAIRVLKDDGKIILVTQNGDTVLRPFYHVKKGIKHTLYAYGIKEISCLANHLDLKIDFIEKTGAKNFINNFMPFRLAAYEFRVILTKRR
jgi:ubiquinone/menaquinone biosynthesis C-methylase UbiE